MYDRLVVSGFYISHLSCHPPQQTASEADKPQQISARWALFLFPSSYAMKPVNMIERLWMYDKTRIWRMDGTLWATHHQPQKTSCPFQCSFFVFILFPRHIHQHQPFLGNLFWISHCLSFEPPSWRPTQLHPPVTLMVFSHINQLIKSKFQWWINLPGLMRWSASCCYQSTCCQMIVSCWNVWHYEVHLESPAE